MEWFTWPSIDPVLRARTQCWAEKQRALQFLGRLSERFASMGSLPNRLFFLRKAKKLQREATKNKTEKTAPSSDDTAVTTYQAVGDWEFRFKG